MEPSPHAPSVDDQPYSRYERVYLLLAATFAVVLVLTNIIGIKLFPSPINPEWALTTGILTYPLTFLVTDIVSEVYGKRRADFMVVVGFLMSLVMLAVDTARHAHAAAPVLGSRRGGLLPRRGGLPARLRERVLAQRRVADGVDAGVPGCPADRQLPVSTSGSASTKGRYLWIRNNGSTIVSQLVDTIIVNSILFYLGFGWEFWQGVTVMGTIYLHKVLLAALDTPLIYLGVYLVRRFIDAEQETG